MNILLESLKAVPQVEMAQLDLDWMKRLDVFLSLGQRVIYALSLLLGLGVIFIISSMIHLATQIHKEEILVLRLVGANNAFIRRPFLYIGMWYGLLSSLLACILLNAFFFWLSEPSKLLGQLYESTLSMSSLHIKDTLSLLSIGVSLGVLASWIVLHKHLSAAEI